MQGQFEKTNPMLVRASVVLLAVSSLFLFAITISIGMRETPKLCECPKVVELPSPTPAHTPSEYPF